MRRLYIIVVLLCLGQPLSAQWRKSWALSGGGGYGLGLYDVGKEVQRNIAGDMHFVELNLRASYYIMPRWALGLDISGQAYYKAEESCLPLALHTQYDFSPLAFAYLNAGAMLSGGATISEGFLGTTGIGCRLWQSADGWSINAAMRYRIMNYANSMPMLNDKYIYDERWNHSLIFNISVEYTFASMLLQNERAISERRENARQTAINSLIMWFFDRRQ